ncbi:MAG: cobalt transport protein [Synechococcales cyanobacterium CRU_2_2]|nr:cobalt transport protein [Synechococcales cyanobacterium CRU_2_2]
MSDRTPSMKYRIFFLSGLGIALAIAALLSPFASPSPDGLNRVAEDLGFVDKEHPEPAAQKLPFAKVFDGYALRGVPEQIATPVAGLVGALATFGVAWGLGKLVARKSASTIELESHD